MHTLASDAPVPDCSVVGRLLLELARGEVDLPDARAPFPATLCAGDPTNEDAAGRKPSVPMHRVSAHRTVHRVLAMVPESGAIYRVNARRVLGVKTGVSYEFMALTERGYLGAVYLEISDLCPPGQCSAAACTTCPWRHHLQGYTCFPRRWVHPCWRFQGHYACLQGGKPRESHVVGD